jgi:hypothetical protein
MTHQQEAINGSIILWVDPEDWESRVDALLIINEGSTIGIQQRDNYVEIHKEGIPDLIKILKKLQNLK